MSKVTWNRKMGKKSQQLHTVYPISQILRSHSALGIIILVGLSVRILNISSIPLHGDEYSSIREAQNLGMNMNGILYYYILHLWMKFSGHVVWMRLLSVLLGLISLPFAYILGQEASCKRVGIITAAIFAVHPFAVDISQYIRHYSLFLMLSTAALAETITVLNQKRWRHRLTLAIIMVLLPFSHIFGILVTGAVLFVLYTEYGRWPSTRLKRLFLVVGLTSISVSILVMPDIRTYGWRFIARLINSRSAPSYLSSRGLSFVHIAKMALSIYVFTAGRYVYPMIFPVVLPTAIISATSFVLGIYAMRKQQKMFPILVFLSFVGFVLLIADPLAPPFSETAGPRHASMAWPAFAVLLAVGSAHRRKLMFALLTVIVTCLMFLYFSDWAYERQYQDWPGTAQYVSSFKTPKFLVLYDGRSAGPVQFYFHHTIRAENYWRYLNTRNLDRLDENDRLVFITNDFRESHRREFSHFLRKIERRFYWVEGQVSYPLFVYIFDRKKRSDWTYVIDDTGQLHHPIDILGLEFADLKLPQTVKVGKYSMRIVGAFALPNLDGQREVNLEITRSPRTEQFIVVSNVLNAASMMPGEPVALIQVTDESDKLTTFYLRLGRETQTWNKPCPAEASCISVLRWHKRIAFVGQRRYPGAWRDFQAYLAATKFLLPKPMYVSSVNIRLLCNKCSLYVWGISFPPE